MEARKLNTLGQTHILVEIKVNDIALDLFLDTALPTTVIGPEIEFYNEPMARIPLAGFSGNIILCDSHILPIDLDQAAKEMSVLKCDEKVVRRGLLGLDAIDGRPLKLNFQESQMDFIESLPDLVFDPIYRFPEGHFMIRVAIGGKRVSALFDTAADYSLVDTEFVKKNPQLFEPIEGQRTSGADFVGEEVTFELYRAKKLKIQDVNFQDTVFAAVDFTTLDMGLRMPIILGANVIATKNWILDLENNRWSVQAFEVE